MSHRDRTPEPGWPLVITCHLTYPSAAPLPPPCCLTRNTHAQVLSPYAQWTATYSSGCSRQKSLAAALTAATNSRGGSSLATRLMWRYWVPCARVCVWGGGREGRGGGAGWGGAAGMGCLPLSRAAGRGGKRARCRQQRLRQGAPPARPPALASRTRLGYVLCVQAVVVGQVQQQAHAPPRRRLLLQQPRHRQPVARLLGQGPVGQDGLTERRLHGHETGGAHGRTHACGLRGGGRGVGHHRCGRGKRGKLCPGATMRGVTGRQGPVDPSLA